MHNVNVAAIEETAALARREPAAVVQHVAFAGEWQTFPPPMGGTGSAPNPLTYSFWGGLACYAMTYAQEAALRGVELHALRARVKADAVPTRLA